MDHDAIATLTNNQDWSSQADPTIAGAVQALNGSWTTLTVYANGNAPVATDNYFYTAGGGLVLGQATANGVPDTIQQLASGVMNAGIPDVCAVGVTASIRKVNLAASVGGSGGGTVGGSVNNNSSSGYMPQNTGGADLRSASPLFKTIPVGVYVSNDGSRITSVSVDFTVKKVGVTAYANLGTYTASSGPPACP